MKKEMIFTLLLVFAFLGWAEEKNLSKKGLSKKNQVKLKELLSYQNHPKKFKLLLEKIAASGKYESITILTHAMFELPWDQKLIPKYRHDYRMPKLAVEYRLDNLVGSTEHDILSARYFRSLLKSKGNLNEAKNNLLKWIFDHRNKLKWDGSMFVLSMVSHRGEITLATAQRFHAFIKNVGSSNGLECRMSGFPIWRTRGLEPSLGRVGEWRFSTPSNLGGKQVLSRVILVIRLVPSPSYNQRDFLFKWGKYDVIVVRMTDFKQKQGSTDSLVTALKRLNAKSMNHDKQ